jgi:flagellar biosynthesis GTPase FlhF
MSRFLVLLSLGLSLLISAEPARAEKRVALVIGVSAYQRVPRLPNPIHDAEAMAALFRKAGFDSVDEKRDVGIVELRRLIRDFSETSKDADIAVVYYAGHGMEVDGANYLIPADAKLVSDFDVEDEAISLDRVLRAIEPVKRLRLVILDACRDNPFSRTMKRTVASRAIGRGLAKVEPATPNTLVAFATRAGAVADDGNGDNSQYTSALVKYITEPGVDVRVAFGRVRDEVLKKTSNRQEPFVYGSLGGDDLALVPRLEKPAPRIDTEARIDYEYAAQIGTKDVWDSFLANHPAGFYTDLARAQRNRLVAAEQSQAAADKARRDAEEQAAQKAEQLQKRLDEQPANQVATATQQDLSEQSNELEAAKKQAELARQQAEVARQEVEQAKRQAAEDAQRQLEDDKRTAKDTTDKNSADKNNGDKVAALTPPQTDQPAAPSSSPKIGQADIARLLQAHLKRVGCNSGKVDGDWDESSQHALELFNKNAKTKFDIKVASLDALDAVRDQHDRVCPLICERGERAVGNRCVEIGCASGYYVNSHGSCERERRRESRFRSVMRAPIRPHAHGLDVQTAPLPTTTHTLGGDCVLDGSGHRNGGSRCRNF